MRCLSSVLLVLSVACGGVSQSVLLEERTDQAEYIEAVHRAALAMGHEVRYQEGRQLVVYVDREAGTRITFAVKRRGIVMVTRTAGGEDVPQEVQDAELARADQIGREIYQAAGGQQELILAERRAAEEQERIAEEQERIAEEQEREERARNGAQNQAQLRAFMEQNQQRNQANAVGFDEPAPAPNEGPSNDSGSGSGASGSADTAMRCCVNGAAYSCPNSAAMDQCAGRFMRCINREGMSGMESCLQTDPPDPSACDRNASLDSEC